MWNLSILSIFMIIFSILLGCFFSFLPNELSNTYLGFILSLTLLSLIVFSSRKKLNSLKGNYITISSIFIFSYLAVHFQYYFDYYFGLRNDLALRYYLDYSVVPKAATLACIALLAFLIGNVIYNSFSNGNFSIEKNNDHNFSEFFLKLLIIVFFALFLIYTPLSYFRGGYGEMMNNEGIGYMQYKSNHLFQISLWAYIISKVIKLVRNNDVVDFYKYFKNFNFFIYIIIIFYIFLNILSGDRGPIINIIALYGIGYLIACRKKIKLRNIILVIFIGGLFIEFLGYFRVTDGSGSFGNRFNSALILQEEIKSRGEQTIFPPTDELAKSLKSYHAVVMDQNYNPPLYGLGNLDYLIAIIPGLGILLKYLFSIKFIGTATYITQAMGADHGMGTTALADIYLNYRFIGVIFIFLFFGWYFARLDNLSFGNFKNNSLFTQVSFFVFIISALYLGRSSFVIVFSDIVLVYIILRISILVKR